MKKNKYQIPYEIGFEIIIIVFNETKHIITTK